MESIVSDDPMSPSRTTTRMLSTYGFFALACSVTWLFALPTASAWMRHEAPSPIALGCAGLSAFGPLIAAVIFSIRERTLGETFGRFRTNPGWIVLSLAAPFIVHTLATAVYAVLGGHPSQWFHPPVNPEQMAALVVFPLGEEFG